MGPLVIDIETSGAFHELPAEVQTYLVEREERHRGMHNDDTATDAMTEVVESLPLNPAAGVIVSIGMWLPSEGRGAVLVNNAQGTTKSSQQFERYDDHTAVYYGSEAEILKAFWPKVLEKAGPGGRAAEHPLVTFNGRSFDGPFLMLRSALHGIKPTRNMVGYRYSLKDHCDLQEVFCLMGSLDRKHRFSLDFWCHQFGIDSPKQDMDGSQVGDVWRAGEIGKLIQYSTADVRATAELYEKAKPLIKALQP